MAGTDLAASEKVEKDKRNRKNMTSTKTLLAIVGPLPISPLAAVLNNSYKEVVFMKEMS